MKRIDYLKLAIKHRLYAKLKWIISAFSITKSKKENPFPGQLVREEWGYSFKSFEVSNLEWIKIEDADPSKPLFSFKDTLIIDPSWLPNVSQETQTTVGNVLWNAVLLVEAFGNKFPFVTGKMKIKAIENQIAKKLSSTPKAGEPRSAALFYADELVVFNKNVTFITSASQLACYAATPKTMVPPTGIKEFKAKLIEEYKGKLHDPLVMAEFESKLKAFDAEFLKGDPADGTFIDGKIKEITRKKMFLTSGGEVGFGSGIEVVPVINSLADGWPTDPEQYTAMMSSLRAGSYSRGAETVNGGVTAKVFLRAANNYRITPGDCGSKFGRRFRVSKLKIKRLIERSIVDNGQVVFIPDAATASNYLGKTVVLRSPMYCKANGESICSVCAGKRLSENPDGISIAVTEESAIILTSSLKKMHGTVLSTARLDLKEIFT